MSSFPGAPNPATSAIERWRGWAILAAILVGILLTLALQPHPSATLSEEGHLVAWGAAVDTALASPDSGCNAPDVFKVTRLAGFGAVGVVCVNHGAGPGSLEVTFEAATGPGGLAYVTDFPLPYGQCSRPLGARWFELSAGAASSASCPSGYTMDPRP